VVLSLHRYQLSLIIMLALTQTSSQNLNLCAQIVVTHPILSTSFWSALRFVLVICVQCWLAFEYSIVCTKVYHHWRPNNSITSRFYVTDALEMFKHSRFLAMSIAGASWLVEPIVLSHSMSWGKVLWTIYNLVTAFHTISRRQGFPAHSTWIGMACQPDMRCDLDVSSVCVSHGLCILEIL